MLDTLELFFTYLIAFMHKIQQLTIEGSTFQSNESGHVENLEAVMFILRLFFALYICSWMFLVFFLSFVHLSISSTEWWTNNKMNADSSIAQQQLV